MSWKVQTQFSRPNAESNSEQLEWSAVVVETQEEAEAWWKCRTSGRSVASRVHTMMNPAGEVVRVAFN